MTDVTGTACGERVGRGPGGLGQVSHWNKHLREYREAHGKPAESMDEIRDWLNNKGGFNGSTGVEDGRQSSQSSNSGQRPSSPGEFFDWF
jgi:hypothetical protein